MAVILERKGGGRPRLRGAACVMSLLPESAQFLEEFIREFLIAGAVLLFEEGGIPADVTFH